MNKGRNILITADGRADYLNRGMLLLILLLLLLFPENNMAQSVAPDMIYAHRDKPFYVSGETIFIKVYLFNEDISPSGIIHAELTDGDGKRIVENLFTVRNNTCQGKLDIPLNLSQGIYVLKIYSIWNFNFDNSCNYVEPVAIYNDFELPGSSASLDRISTENTPLSRNGNAGLEIRILNRDSIRTGGKVSLEILNLKNVPGVFMPNISLSVFDPGQCGYPDLQAIYKRFRQQAGYSISPDGTSFKPENQIRVEGSISELGTGDAVTSSVISVFNTETATFTRIRSRNGDFSLELPVFRGNSLLQVINMNPFEPKLNRVEKKYLSDLIPVPGDIPVDPEINPVVDNYLYHSRIRRKVREIYEGRIQDTLWTQRSKELPFVPDRTYLMDQYQLLRNVEDFMREAVLNTSHITEEGKRKILLYNQETKKFFMRSPWFLVDGQFIFNDSITYNIPFSVLRRIDIYNRDESITRYFDPIMIQGGVVAIYTKNNYLGNYVMEQPNTVLIRGLPEVNVSGQTEMPDLNAEPDLDPVIYWNPEILFDKNGRALIEFQANDVSGKYLIHVEGMDAAGKPLSGQAEIEVWP